MIPSLCVHRVSFPESVKWLCIEFDPKCGTAQAEDTLQLYVPSVTLTTSPLAKKSSASAPTSSGQEDPDNDTIPVPYWPILHKFSRSSGNWPQTAVVLPGEVYGFLLGVQVANANQ